MSMRTNLAVAAQTAHTPVPVILKKASLSGAGENLARIAAGQRVTDVYRGQERSWWTNATPEKVDAAVSDNTLQGYARLLAAIS